MKPMSPEGIAAWEKQKAKGKSDFIYRKGALWGMIMTVAMNLIFIAIGDFTLARFLTSLPAYWIGGFFFGFFLWHWLERKYQKTIEGNTRLMMTGVEINNETFAYTSSRKPQRTANEI